MRAALLVLLAALLGVAHGQTPSKEELLGKTPTQVAALGREAWFTFYTGRQGDSTAGMANAEHLFARALGFLNDRRIAQLPAARQATLKALRKNLRDYAFACIDVGRAHSGGGTMWVPVSAGAGADVETVLAALLGTKTPPAPRRRVSDVTRRLDRAVAITRARSKDIDTYRESSGTSGADALKLLADARRLFQKVVAEAAKRPRGDSDRLLEFCFRWADVAHPEN